MCLGTLARLRTHPGSRTCLDLRRRERVDGAHRAGEPVAEERVEDDAFGDRGDDRAIHAHAFPDGGQALESVQLPRE